MKKSRLAIIIMLFAGTAIAFACLFNKIELVPSLLYIAATLLIFYIIGLIIQSIITKINKEAEARAKELAKQRKEAEERALEEEEEQEEEEAAEIDQPESESSESDTQ